MKNSEEAIAKVLTALRDTEAPEGMERRILKALEDRSSAPSRSVWPRSVWQRMLQPPWRAAPMRPVAISALACGIAFAGLFAVVLAIPAIRRFGHAPAQSSPQSPSQSKRNAAPSGSLLLATPATAAKDAPLPPPGSRARSIARKNASEARAVRDSDSVALNEMHGASFPAPPMPLTEQEKLLLRIAHKGDPVELAMLDPVVRATRDAEEKADVKNFFEPPTTGQSTTKGNE
jgi:hypothetical protein